MKKNLLSPTIDIESYFLRAEVLSHSLFPGNYRSRFLGRGWDFEEIRPYTLGDDPSLIDWKTTARKNTPYTKQFLEARQFPFHFLIDVGTTMQTSSPLPKYKTAIETFLLLACSVLKKGDLLSVLLFSDKIDAFYPLSSKKEHLLEIAKKIHSLTTRETLHTTSFSLACEHIMSYEKHQAGIIFLSDFCHLEDKEIITHLRQKGTLLPICFEENLDLFLDCEGVFNVFSYKQEQPFILDNSSQKTKTMWKHALKRKKNAIAQFFTLNNTDILFLKSGEDPYLPLLDFLKKEL